MGRKDAGGGGEKRRKGGNKESVGVGDRRRGGTGASRSRRLVLTACKYSLRPRCQCWWARP